MKLGTNQRIALRSLVRFKSDCGWIFRNRSTTRGLLDALVLKGLAERRGERYVPTALGIGASE